MKPGGPLSSAATSWEEPGAGRNSGAVDTFGRDGRPHLAWRLTDDGTWTAALPPQPRSDRAASTPVFLKGRYLNGNTHFCDRELEQWPARVYKSGQPG